MTMLDPTSRLYAKIAALFCCIALTFASRQTSASERCRAAHPWSNLNQTGSHFAQPLPLALVGGAGLSAALLIPSGADHELRVVAQRDLGGTYNQELVSIWTPFVIGGGVALGYGVSAALGQCESQRVFAALFQGMTLTLVATSLLKITFGREFPTGGADPFARDRLEHPDRATDFDPFTTSLGAWPSGHAALTFAFAAALRSSAPELGLWRWAGYPVAAAVSFGMWHGDHHWASDVVSGAMLGEALGGSSGAAFMHAESASTAGVIVVPLSGGGAIQYSGLW
jgi:membrane-associated phospholipid phosphatase